MKTREVIKVGKKLVVVVALFFSGCGYAMAAEDAVRIVNQAGTDSVNIAGNEFSIGRIFVTSIVYTNDGSTQNVASTGGSGGGANSSFGGSRATSSVNMDNFAIINASGVSVGSVVQSSLVDVVGGSLTVRGAGAGLHVRGNAQLDGSVTVGSATFSGTVTTTSPVKGGHSVFTSVNAGSGTFTQLFFTSATSGSPGPGVIGSSSSFYFSGASATLYLDASSVTITQVQQNSTNTWVFAGGSVTINGVYVSTQNSQLIPFFGYNSVGVSTNVVAIATSPLNQIPIFAQDTSSPTNHVTVRAWIPQGRSLYRAAIMRDFQVVLASAVGNLQSYDNNNVTYAVTFATYSPIISVGTAAYSNPNNVTVTGASAPGGIRRITDQALNGITALVGNGGCWLSAKITTVHGNVNSGWLGMVLEFFDYQ